MSSTAAAAHAGDAHHPQQQPQLTLEQLVAERRWTDLLRAAQTKELDEGGLVSKESELWYCIELYAAALSNQLLITRFIWKRIHKDIKKSSKNVAIVWKLLQSLHRGDFTTYFSEAAGYQAGLSTPLLQQLNQALRQETQSANLLNIRRAYATIGVEQASPLLGTKPAETIALFTQLGWQPDAAAAGGAGAAGANQFFNPTPLEIPKQRQITEAQIEQLTRYVADLEKE